jgi:hypothetical protein
MKRHMLKAMIVILGLFAWVPLQAYAGQLLPHEEQAIQSAVQLQIDALTKDDADSAFALATTDTRNRLGTPDNFLRLIKEQYDPVYRHRLALFSEPTVVDNEVYQLVRLTDLNNQVWVAIYLMLKDEDGSWKIDGCQLVETTTVSV